MTSKVRARGPGPGGPRWGHGSRVRARGPDPLDDPRWGLNPLCSVGIAGRRWLSDLSDPERTARVKAYVWERAGRSRDADLAYDSDLEWLDE